MTYVVSYFIYAVWIPQNIKTSGSMNNYYRLNIIRLFYWSLKTFEIWIIKEMIIYLTVNTQILYCYEQTWEYKMFKKKK